MFDKIKKFFKTEADVMADVGVTPAWAVSAEPPVLTEVHYDPEPKVEKVIKPRANRGRRGPKPPKVELPPMSLTPAEIAKAEATAKGEPWVTVISLDMDMDNVGAGSFNLDFNEVFVARLVKAGYRGKNDFDIVDQWFTEICKNVALETFAQDMADPDKRAEWNEKSTPTS